MKNMSQHTEWLSMIEVSGPFLAVPVLEKIFPQGLESLETYRKKRIRLAYEEWRDAVEEKDPQLPELHRAWIELVLKELLEYEDSVLQLVTDDADFTYKSPDGDGQFTPDYVLRSEAGEKPMLFVSIFPEGTDLEKVKIGDGWPVSIFERMTLFCRNQGVRLGLISNGERWMLVNAPIGNTSSHVSWYARLWFQEPVTLKAFQSLLGVRRWFGPEEEAMPAMLEESLQHHEEVTDTLGEQVKRAVEVLVQCLDKANQDRNRELLHDVPPAELYEAGLTVMMRLVFVLCAEERGLLLLGDSIYDQYYAITTLRGQLAEEADQHGHEVLERRHDAWARLLAVFRAVFTGVEHETLRMPALGGSLFDPDRFAFLEGRAKGTHWQDTPAQPLPIDNRTVLLLLDALQVLEQRGGALLLSYKALDVEQIGHVYEGLLEHTVRRLSKDTLGMIGSQKAKNPNLTLAELESARLDGEEALISIVKSATLRSKSAIGNALGKEVDDNTFGKIVTVCGGDMDLAKRIKPFAHLLRTDAWGDFIFYRANSFAVTLGADRRETGTHYTPKSLTESIVETTLQPIAYVGPAEGLARDEWQLKSAAELLELKICDPAMGSGAFLVQVCRWLSERLVEAWGKEAAQGKYITVDGLSLDVAGSAEPMPDSLDERLLFACRLVAEKCLYGVDLNPLAVELAKLSIWLITLAKGRPFGFLDHNLRSGDSLLGLHKLEQLTKFSLHPDKKQIISIFASNIEAAVKDTLILRKKLRETPIRDIRDVQCMERLDHQARQKLEHIEHIADAMIGEALASGGNERALGTAMDNLSTWAAAYIEGDNETGRKIIAEARRKLSIDLPKGKPPRKPFHWALVFPEVFERGGFDGIVGNPPFRAGRFLSSDYGGSYLKYLQICPYYLNGQSDLCAAFCMRAFILLRSCGCSGFITTNSISEGDTRSAYLKVALTMGGQLIWVKPSVWWPGKAQVVVSLFVISKQALDFRVFLNDVLEPAVDSTFTSVSEILPDPQPLFLSKSIVGKGVGLGSKYFRIDSELACRNQLKPDHNIRRFITGINHNSSPDGWGGELVFWFEDIKNENELIQVEAFDIFNNATHGLKKNKYWLYRRGAANLYSMLNGLKYCIIRSQTSSTWMFSFWPKVDIFDQSVIAFGSNCRGLYSVINSSIHEAWVMKYGGSLKTDTGYSPSECFHNYPLPYNPITGANVHLASLSVQMENNRREASNEYNEGNTDISARIHDSSQNNESIKKLRAALSEIDYGVAVAYGWDDLDLGHGLHETQKGIRFTISEEARREVLQRLLKLNHERYEEEVEQGLHDKKKKKASTPRKKKKFPAKDDGNLDLFSFMNVSPKESK